MCVCVCVLNFIWPKYQLCIKDNKPIAHWPGRESTQRANSHGIFSPLPAHISKGHRQGAVAVQHVVRHHEGEGSGDAEVRHEADQEWGHDTDGDGPLGVLHLFTWRDTERRSGVTGIKKLQTIQSNSRMLRIPKDVKKVQKNNRSVHSKGFLSV